MQGSFEVNKPGYFTVKNVAEIEGFDKDHYGNTWYSVVFQGDTETYMWLAKEEPEEGKAYYGHLEPTKSGKKLRFKRDTEEAPPVTHTNEGSKSSADYEPGTNARWAIGLAYKAFIQVTGTPEDGDGNFPFEAVKQHATALVKMFDEIKNSGSHVGVPTPPQATQVSREAATGLDKARATASAIKQKAISWDDEPLPGDEDMPVEEL